MFDIMCLEGLAWVLWVEAVLLKDPHAISGRTWRTRCDNQSWVAICMSGKCARSPAAAVLLALKKKKKWIEKITYKKRSSF
jgi:hypothetical protein